MNSRVLFLLPALLLCLAGCGISATGEASAATQVLYSSAESEPIPADTTSPTEEVPPMETQSMILPNPEDWDFVRVLDYIPDAVQDLKYATADNFTGSVIYDFQDVYLRYGTVKKLMAVQEELRPLGLRVKLWDGFRPVSFYLEALDEETDT